VNGADATLETAAGVWPLSWQSYVGGSPAPEVPLFLESYTNEPWPTRVLGLPDGTRVALDIVARHGQAQVLLRWRLPNPEQGGALLRVRPFLSGRDYHSLHHENSAFRFDPEVRGERLYFRPYDGVPGIEVASNGGYRHEPRWYRRFHCAASRR
jgi:hypothetical protein